MLLRWRQTNSARMTWETCMKKIEGDYRFKALLKGGERRHLFHETLTRVEKEKKERVHKAKHE